MKHFCKQAALALATTLIVAGCAENTGSLGIVDTPDRITTSTDVFSVTTRSIPIGAIPADNTNAYLGRVIDPETGSAIEADCAAQFYCLEDYSLPKKSCMVGNITVDPATGDTLSIEHGVVQCDSCEVRIYISQYYGDANNPMKLEVCPLDETHIMEEETKYYTDIDLSQYVKESEPLATKVFTAKDYIVSETDRNNANYTDNIRIMLPASFGQQILEKGYANPDALKSPYRFIREIFPGFYFRISSGEGTMLKMLVSTFNIYYDYCDEKKPNITYQGVTRFSATPEVIQSTHFTNDDISELLQETRYTYLKTPAGLCTEMTLPVDEVFDNHPTDSVSRAQIVLTRYNKEQDNYQLGTPTSLLMLRKQDMTRFFENHQVNDNRTSYVSSFDAVHNTYTYANLSRLLAYCKYEKRQAALNQGITEEQWAAANPDWNKVVLIPVSTSTDSQGKITSITHDMGMNSIKLIGGNTKISMQVVYSKFQ